MRKENEVKIAKIRRWSGNKKKREEIRRGNEARNEKE